MRLLVICGALAIGEYAASFVPECAEAWPAVALCAVLVALFAYGLGARGLGCASVLLVGVTLFFFASREEAQRCRESPWMRGREWRCRSRPSAPSGTLREVKGGLSRRIGFGLEHDRESASLARAILLGERRGLPRRTRQLFVDSGTMHVFAISGLHVMAVAELLLYALLLLAVPLRLAGVASVPLLWGYVWLIGFPPSAVRAAMMATFSASAPALWRRVDGLRSWALTFLSVHLVCPRQIVDVGSVLSFAVMLAIVLVGDCVRDLPRWARALCVTFAAWAAGVPVSAHIFGRVTPGGLLSNFVLLAAARLAVVSGALGLALGCLSKSVSAHLNNLMSLAIRAMVLVADAVTRIPGTNFETGRWTLWACLGWYVLSALSFALVLGLVRRRRWPSASLTKK